MTKVITTAVVFTLSLATPIFSVMADGDIPQVEQAISQDENNNCHNKARNLPNTNEQRALDKGPGGKPPQLAIDICLAQSENSFCSFQGPQGLEEGGCEFTPDKQYFACKPNKQGKQPGNQNISEKQVTQFPSHLSDKHN